MLPRWLLFVCAALVITFGVYRIVIAFQSPRDDAVAQKRAGLFGMARRTHFLVGVIYLILGTFLILSALGWKPPFQLG